MTRKLFSESAVERHILLLKLTEVLANAPGFGDEPTFDVNTPQRQWLSEVGALLSRLGPAKGIAFRSTFNALPRQWNSAITQIKGQILDAIQEITLELELNGRSDIGSAYPPGDVYRFFADLKAIVNGAESSIEVVDPYFDGEAFDSYLSTAKPNLQIRILADRYSKDVKSYVDKHKAQFQSQIALRRSNELHDRLVFIDDSSSWIIGGSIKDAAKKKATYLIPLASELTKEKRKIYGDIWNRASELM